MVKYILILFAFTVPVEYSAQKRITGQLIQEDNKVRVENINTGKSTFTDAMGRFSIAAVPRDKIYFTKNTKKILVYTVLPQDTSLILKVPSQVIDIEEVKIGLKITGNLKKRFGAVSEKGEITTVTR